MAVASPVRGLTVIAGGKYTTYRVMAKDVVDFAVHGSERSVPESITDRVPLIGAEGYPALYNNRHLTALRTKLRVHVIEHFWRWEVVDILREWVRVLRPGGRLVLECPNLLTACEELLKDPANGAQPGPEGQRTMWVFYGDPAWRDPLMCHRWNYTPASLAAVRVRSRPRMPKS